MKQISSPSFNARMLALILLGFLLSSCVTLTNPETTQDYSQDTVGIVSENQTVGQTFTSNRPRLNRITLWVNKDPPTDSASHPLTILLYHSTRDTTPLAETNISVMNNGSIDVKLPTQVGPAGQSYYLLLKTDGRLLQVMGRNSNVFPDGQAYINQQPVEADIAFRTSYDYDLQAMLEDLRNIIPSLWLVLPLGVLLFVPGFLLLDLSGLRERFDGGEQIAIMVGLSLAIIPLLMLWTSTIGLHWTRLAVIISGFVLTCISLWRMRHRITIPRLSYPGLILILIFFFSLAVRLAMVRDLVAPEWVDSVHHALITRLILDHGTFPTTYAPFLSLLPTKYHVGFHSSLAAYLWLSGSSIPQGMLTIGQVLNAFSIFAVYLFTTTLTRNKTAGVIAALVTGIFSPMPAYYTSWGRYTELAGLLIMPVSLAFIRPLIGNEGEKSSKAEARDYMAAGSDTWKTLLIAGIAAGGLLLVHYRVAAFLACLILAYCISQVRLEPKTWLPYLKRVSVAAGVIAFGTLILCFPWVWPNLNQTLPATLSVGSVSGTAAFSDFSWRYLTAAFGQYSLVVAGVGLVWGIIFRKRFIIALVAWITILFFLANLGALNLPGGWFINNTSVEIALFFPISLLAGFITSETINLVVPIMPPIIARSLQGVLILVGIILAALGAQALLPILNPTTDFVRSADLPAIAWVKDHIPDREQIAINPFNWGYGLCAGNDGGYWISPLAEKITVPPAALYGFGDPQEVSKVNNACKEILNRASNTDDLWAYLHSQGIRYLYLGARGGPFSPQSLLGSLHFQVLYAQGGVWVFETLPQ